jgi:hypothetical protein
MEPEAGAGPAGAEALPAALPTGRLATTVALLRHTRPAAGPLS